MLSRTLLARNLFFNAKKFANLKLNSKRNSGHGVWSYRVPPPLPPKSSIYLAEVIGGLCWFWILYHIATQPELIYGEFEYIDPRTYTDEELGIPPDSAGPLKN